MYCRISRGYPRLSSGVGSEYGPAFPVRISVSLDDWIDIFSPCLQVCFCMQIIVSHKCHFLDFQYMGE